ncbi:MULTISPECIES: fimbrial protein [Klebsiella]|uniref:fimbrial protein n=1 Tax=Klebsiella TaxID=570 RepID=UPI000B41CF65|nr:fimbrial protein [Klebsiella quasipneumoniae]AVO76337.1 fimbrial protein [Klebsiella pneumoniae]MBC4315222.1 fimbrial protein [Klebsiella quasipneumoniae]MCZ9598320.1 fimbrial protein [Klebsiella quasipneumoniae]MDE1591486.1 fimbrial protein [Klebsiella quasipneumoniae]MDR4548644.1 fimbrial protein [Klebsiella quasipneumoniae]
MKKILFFISLFFINLPAIATCSYSSGSEANVNLTVSSKILSDNTLPAGSILAVRTVGGNVSSMRTFSNCGTSDLYGVIASPAAVEAPGVSGIQGGKVYETGIPGIGYQISDAISGTNYRPNPATMGTVSAWNLVAYPVSQITVWLIKTKDNIDTSIKNSFKVNVSYMAGSAQQIQANSSSARLLKVNVTLGPFTYRDTSCNVTPRNGSVVTLSNIEASQLKSLAQGAITGKQKDITLDITCPQTSLGTKYIYWFNPITENSSSIDGVLVNNIPQAAGGAKDVGFIIKKGSSAIKFYDYKSYSISSVTKNQSITLTADYYKLSENITPGAVQGIFEVILQEE